MRLGDLFWVLRERWAGCIGGLQGRFLLVGIACFLFVLPIRPLFPQVSFFPFFFSSFFFFFSLLTWRA